MGYYAWLFSCWKWSIKLSYCCCYVLPPSVMWFPQPGALLLGTHQSAVALLPIQLICFAFHSIILYHLRHIFSDYFVWRTFDHAVFCCSPCCGTSLPSFLHSVQCRITSDTLCLSIGGFRPFVSEVITAWPQSNHSSFWCLFLLCLPVGLVPLLPFIPCVFLMFYDPLGFIRIDIWASSTGIFRT